MRVLGIDPGLRLTGYGCLDVDGSQGPATVIEAGVLRFKPGTSVAYRLRQLYEDLTGLLDELRPQRVVVEQVFSHARQVRTSIIMGHARGVVLLVMAQHGVHIEEMAPSAIKKATTGRGNATKAQMQLAIMTQLGLDEPPQPADVADALAMALCGARRAVVDEVPVG